MDNLGACLRYAGFLPLPLVDDDGNLAGTHLWRTRGPGLVECLRMHHSGLALAVRAVARFDYTRPLEHGRVLDHRFGRAEDALEWLVLSAREAPSTLEDNDSEEDHPCSAPTWS